MEMGKVLTKLLKDEECYKVFRVLWTGGKSFPEIQEHANIKNLNEVLYQLQICGLIHLRGVNCYEISPCGEWFKDALSELEKEISKKRPGKDIYEVIKDLEHGKKL